MPKKQKSGLYRSKVRIGVDANGKPIDKWISGKTKRELEEQRQQIIAYYIENDALEADRLFGDYAVEWYRTRKEPGISASSRESYRSTLNNHILPAFGNRNMRAIRAMELQNFVNEFAGSSATRITVVMAALTGIFESACADRLLEHNPTAHLIKPQAKPAAEKRALTLDERTRLEAACAEHEHGLYLALLYYLGVRPGESRGLMWGDIDWDAHTIHVQRDIDYKDGGKVGALKTAASDRLVPIPAPLEELLRRKRGLPNTFILSGERSGDALAKSSAERMWLELMEHCGMVEVRDPNAYDIRKRVKPQITPHVLRHNYITMCYENNFDVYTTMRIVGHTNIQTTLGTYTHLSKAQFGEAARQIDEMFSGAKVAQKLHKP